MQINLMKTFLSLYAVMFVLSMKVSNPLSVVLAVLLYLFYQKCQGERESKNSKGGSEKTAWVVGGIFAAFTVLTKMTNLDQYDYNGIQKVLAMIPVSVGLIILYGELVNCFYRISAGWSFSTDQKPTKTQEKLFMWEVWGLILLCWLPFYLWQFPGVVISDSSDQMGQALAMTYRNHHPVVQTWIIQLALYLGRLIFDSLTAGIAIYCVAQMIVVAAIYAYVTSKIFAAGIRRRYCLIVMAFYALAPWQIMFSFNMWKDTLFSTFILLLTCILWNAMNQTTCTIQEYVLCILAGTGMCLFRNNGFYAFLVLLPFASVCYWKRNKRLVASLWVCVLLTIIVRGPVFQYYQVEEPDFVESLSIPLQQIASVVAVGGELTDAEREQLGQIMEVDRLAAVYEPSLSDPVKGLVREMGNEAYLVEHKMEYLKLWAKIGLRNPSRYLRAYISQTEGYWNPDIQRWQYTEGIWDTQMDMQSHPIITGFPAKVLQGYVGNWYIGVPLVGFLWSIGGMVWICILLAGRCVAGKQRAGRKTLILFLPVFVLWGTLMVATPVSAEFRYLYGMFLCMPVYIISVFSEKKKEEAI